jgi:hypothetical protein
MAERQNIGSRSVPPLLLANGKRRLPAHSWPPSILIRRVLFLDVDGIYHTNGAGISAPDPGQTDQQPWQKMVKQLPRFKVSSAVLTNGEVRVLGVPGKTGAEIAIDRLNLQAENITNSLDLAPTLMAKISADARILATGTFQLQAQGYPLAEVPTFNADLSCSDIDLN